MRAKYRDNAGYHARKEAQLKKEKEFAQIEALASNKEKLELLCKKFPKSYPIILKSSRFKELLAWIIKKTPLLDDTFFKLSTRIFWILHDMKEFPTCANEQCNNPVKKNVNIVFGNYPQFCSQTCINQSSCHIEACKKTIKKHGGHRKILERSFATYKSKTGYSNPASNPSVIAKARKTYKEKYGYDCAFKDPEALKKRAKTWKAKYGTSHPMKNIATRKKVAKTTKKNHGVKCMFLSDSYNKFSRKVYRHDGYTFASFPELCYYIYLKDHHVDFEFQPKCNFSYLFNGKMHKYTPDFYLKDEDSYVDIKGTQFFEDHDPSSKMINPYDRSLDALYETKHQCMLKHDVMVITDYKRYVDYAVKTYGRKHLDSLQTSH